MATATYNLALLEVYGLSPALVIADEVCKAADVTVAGVEGNAGADSLVKFVGDAANCRRAIEVARATAERMHARYTATLRLQFEEPARAPLVHSAQEYSAINDANLH